MRRLTMFLVAGAVSAQVHGAAFQNGGFEGCGGTNQFDLPTGSTAIPGWTVSTGTVDWETVPPVGWQSAEGSCSVDLVGQVNVGGVAQTFDTTPGTTYRVSFDLAGNYGALPTVKPLTVTVAGTTQNFTFDTTGRGQFDMGWTPKSFTFVATGPTSTIQFVSDVTGLGGPGNAGAVIDNVAIAPVGGAVASVPLDWAPWAAGALLLAGGLAFTRRRR